MTVSSTNPRKTEGTRGESDKHCALMMVALPRAVPIPRPFIAFGPILLNLRGEGGGGG